MYIIEGSNKIIVKLFMIYNGLSTWGKDMITDLSIGNWLFESSSIIEIICDLVFINLLTILSFLSMLPGQHMAISQNRQDPPK